MDVDSNVGDAGPMDHGVNRGDQGRVDMAMVDMGPLFEGCSDGVVDTVVTDGGLPEQCDHGNALNGDRHGLQHPSGVQPIRLLPRWGYLQPLQQHGGVSAEPHTGDHSRRLAGCDARVSAGHHRNIDSDLGEFCDPPQPFVCTATCDSFFG
jgi:hypothetical protein